MEREPSKSGHAPYDPRQWFSVSKLYERATETETTDVRKDSNKPILNHGSPNKNDVVVISDEYGSYHVGKQVQQEQTKFVPQPLVNNEAYKTEGAMDPVKLDIYIKRLQEMVAPLSHQYKKKFPYDMICQLAHAVMDGTVFEITKRKKYNTTSTTQGRFQ